MKNTNFKQDSYYKFFFEDFRELNNRTDLPTFIFFIKPQTIVSYASIEQFSFLSSYRLLIPFLNFILSAVFSSTIRLLCVLWSCFPSISSTCRIGVRSSKLFLPLANCFAKLYWPLKIEGSRVSLT